MVLSKGLKRLMISSAALLMFASTGFAATSNMTNANAKRHTHVTRKAHVHHHKKSHRNRHAHHHKSYAVAAQASALKSSQNDNNDGDGVQADGYDPSTHSMLFYNDLSTVPEDNAMDSGVSFAQQIGTDPTLSQAQKTEMEKLITPPKANMPFVPQQQDNNVKSAQKKQVHHSAAVSNAPMTVTVKPSQVYKHVAAHAKNASQRQALLKKARMANHRQQLMKKHVAKMSPQQILNKLRKEGALKGVNHREVRSLVRKPNLMRRLMRDYGDIRMNVKPHTKQAKLTMSSISHIRKRASNKHISKAKRAKAIKQLKAGILKLMREAGFHPNKNTQVTIRF